MNPFLDIGINIILVLQSLEWLKLPMQFFSFLGNEEFFLLVMPIFLWCIGMSVGLRLGFLLLISGNLNTVLKLAFHGPRPYWVNTNVKAYSTETTFGIPSGHAQISTDMWGGLSDFFKERWLWIVSVLVIFLIGLSRLYNGVHFPSDVLAGWAIGAVVLWIYIKLEKPVATWFRRHRIYIQLLLALAISLIFILLAVLAELSLGTWTVPQVWVDNAAAAAPGSPPIDPLSFTGIITEAGGLFDLAAGAILLPFWGGFDAGGPIGKRAERFLVGVIGVLVLWRGLDLVFPAGENLVGFTLRYMRYALTGFWISGLAPFVFTRFGLAEKTPLK